MYQMLTGVLPYNTPSMADVERLARGEVAIAPRLRNPRVPNAINDIVVKAMAADIAPRYQRASELLEDLMAARRRSSRAAPSPTARPSEDAQDIQTRLKARNTPPARFCWHCRKPLHARSDRCPFCGEAQ
jgi:hypothetical protein